MKIKKLQIKSWTTPNSLKKTSMRILQTANQICMYSYSTAKEYWEVSEKFNLKLINFTRNNTSPWIRGSIVTFAIFSSMRSKVPLSSSAAEINTPELFDKIE